MELNEFLEWIRKQGKMEALQNFADRICKKQRENASKEAMINYPDWDKCEIDTDSILQAEQPKIEEL